MKVEKSTVAGSLVCRGEGYVKLDIGINEINSLGNLRMEFLADGPWSKWSSQSSDLEVRGGTRIPW